MAGCTSAARTRCGERERLTEQFGVDRHRTAIASEEVTAALGQLSGVPWVATWNQRCSGLVAGWVCPPTTPTPARCCRLRLSVGRCHNRLNLGYP